ncbi:MAG: 2-oxoacid:acceptor oxidoreductase subunit alpha [Chloroflexi bacterium]|nr:2-oxoacid:acceptor oxidoreductase subunit alpha [Chloroflexota bacterium]
MSTAAVEPAPGAVGLDPNRDPVNDFSIVVATVNGSGSQTANNTLIRALFKMGIPVNGKNLFPSNISGLPTWYTIRVSKDGYIARRDTTEILVGFNQQTIAQDLVGLPEGGVCVYNADIKFEQSRTDVSYYGLPVKQLIADMGVDKKLTDRVANMVYVGALVQLLGIEPEAIREALGFYLGGKQKAIDLNYNVVLASAAWTKENLPKQDPFRVESMDKTEGLILIDGNTAGALGALAGGMTVTAWYPITPATSLADGLNEYAPKLRKDPSTGVPTYAIVQAEDEIAAIGMVLGAGWMGARSMTSTSGPGISLMTEFVGFGYYAEVPGVIWDIMRMGPSTGMPTRVSQGDVLKAYYLGHGDVRNICLLPGNVQECFEFGQTAFDLAERFQQPVFVLSDLDLGMNNWMSKPFEYPETPLDRGKVLNAEQLNDVQDWGRYKDVDGDGIPYRTLPGIEHPRGAYFTRGSGHNENAGYTERPDDWLKNMARLTRKHDHARTVVPKPVIDRREGAKVGIIAFGTTDPAIVEARDRLSSQRGIETGYMRLRALPLGEEVRQFIAEHDRLYVVELNTDGQMHKLLQLHTPEYATKLISIAFNDGLPLTPRYVTEQIYEMEQAQ